MSVHFEIRRVPDGYLYGTYPTAVEAEAERVILEAEQGDHFVVWMVED